MKNFVQEGKTLTLTPAADVTAGVGYLFGAALFGVPQRDIPDDQAEMYGGADQEQEHHAIGENGFRQEVLKNFGQEWHRQ